RCETPPTPAEPVVGREMVWLARLIILVLACVLLAGTVTSGAGPHTGSSGTQRIDYSFRALAELHADFALFLIGITLATLFAVRQAGAPARVQRRAQQMFAVMVVQGTLGYTQYFLHDAALVVEFHLAGATLVSIGVLAFYLSLHRHPALDGRDAPAREGTARDRVPTAPGPAVPVPASSR
ncbi:MAG: heme A synthase, partial [Actinomycetota bacterium]|nr:heme A synthase [Actinomycetota bacterium]